MRPGADAEAVFHNDSSPIIASQEKCEGEAAAAQALGSAEAAAAAKMAAVEVDCQAKLLAEIDRYRVR